LTIAAKHWEDRGVNRRIQPSSSFFNPEEVAALFKHGLLAREGDLVIDKGFLAEPHEDPYDPRKCPKCNLIWPEVIFTAVEFTCACGICLLGELQDTTTGVHEGLGMAIENMLEKKSGRPYWPDWPDDDCIDSDPELEKEHDAILQTCKNGELPPELKIHLLEHGWRIENDEDSCCLWAPYAFVAYTSPGTLSPGWEQLIYAIQTETMAAHQRDTEDK
jgi:hypothetical protein